MKLTLLPLQDDNVVRVRSEGSISKRGSEDPLLALLGPHCYTHRVLLSLDSAPSIDTSGICWLASSHKRFTEASGKLVLAAVPPVVLDVLEFLRLTPLLHFAADEQAAGESVAAPAPRPVAPDRPIEPALRFSR
jgi:anti-anti-sigma regulatory factor